MNIDKKSYIDENNNKKRIEYFNKFNNYIKINNVELTKEEINSYIDLFVVLQKLSNNKLTIDEIIDMYDLFSDIVLGKRIDLVYFSSKDSIKGLYKYFENYEVTKGKFSKDEKEKLAFAIYYATCIKVLDEETEELIWSLKDFKSYENILKLYQDSKRDNPDKYDFSDIEKTIDNDTYGYDVNNPIEFTCVSAMYSYLNSLVTTNNHIIKYDREGSISNDNNVLIDEFTIVDETDNKEYTLYLSEYGNYNSQKYPKSFKKRDSEISILNDETDIFTNKENKVLIDCINICIDNLFPGYCGIKEYISTRGLFKFTDYEKILEGYNEILNETISLNRTISKIKSDSKETFCIDLSLFLLYFSFLLQEEISINEKLQKKANCEKYGFFEYLKKVKKIEKLSKLTKESYYKLPSLIKEIESSY